MSLQRFLMVGVDSFEIPHLQRVMLSKPSNLNLTVAWVYVRDYQRITQRVLSAEVLVSFA